MRIIKITAIALLPASLLFSAGVMEESGGATAPPSLENVIAFSNRAEEALRTWLETKTPIIEGYFQQCEVLDDVTCRLNRDRYLLARLDGARGASLLSDRGTAGRAVGTQPADDSDSLMSALVAMLTPDGGLLDPDSYEYTFVNTTILGALHCMVYDISPRGSRDGFTGRVYLETKTWNIVRYTGFSSQVDKMLSPLRNKKSRFRLDGWRVNISKDRWAPSYVYIEEDAPLGSRPDSIVKGQVRAWGYDQVAPGQETRGDLFLTASSSAPQDRAGSWSGPEKTQRVYEKLAEDNVFARLRSAWFVGPSSGLTGSPGEVEMMLNQVVNNLEITNHIVAQPIQCVLLTTGNVEAFLAGNKIVVSRELVNVVPSESALAMILAHFLAHSILGHRKIDPRLAFPDVLRISDAELMASLHFRHSEAEERAADQKAMEILANSPYAKSMEDGALFMQIIHLYRDVLPGLIAPDFGEDLADISHTVQNHPGTRVTPLLDLKDLSGRRQTDRGSASDESAEWRADVFPSGTADRPGSLRTPGAEDHSLRAVYRLLCA